MKPEEFRKIREKIGSQFKVANLLNVSQGQISIWEQGYRPIPEEAENQINAIAGSKEMLNLNKQSVK